MLWVCGIFKTKEWMVGSKLLSNSVLLLVKLDFSLTAFRSARTASKILMIKGKTKTETWLDGKNQLNLPTFFRSMAGRQRINYVTGNVISQVSCLELKLPLCRPLRVGVLIAFKNYKFCPPKIKRNYSRTDGAPIISSLIWGYIKVEGNSPYTHIRSRSFLIPLLT